MRRFLVPLSFLVLLGCNQGTPYAFRLMIPPTAARLGIWLLPYWFWQEYDVYDTFKGCDYERRQLHSLPERWASLSREEQQSWERRIFAQCVPIR